MCKRITCPECHKPGYTGCGRHIEQVLGDVEWEDRCHCEPKKGPLTWLGALLDSALDGGKKRR